MSLNISTRYGGRANAPSLDYPTGSFKNKTAPDAVDGTPLEKDWANDLLGARDAILAAAGLTANGTADTAQASQLLAALQALGLRAATETQAGVLEIATAAEAQALLNDTNAMTPAKLAQALSLRVGHTFLANDWLPLPVGGILQWGVSQPTVLNGGVINTFPIAFPNACLQLTAMPRGSTHASSSNNAALEILSKSQFQLWNWGTAANFTMSWIAIGW